MERFDIFRQIPYDEVQFKEEVKKKLEEIFDEIPFDEYSYIIYPEMDIEVCEYLLLVYQRKGSLPNKDIYNKAYNIHNLLYAFYKDLPIDDMMSILNRNKRITYHILHQDFSNEWIRNINKIYTTITYPKDLEEFDEYFYMLTSDDDTYLLQFTDISSFLLPIPDLLNSKCKSFIKLHLNEIKQDVENENYYRFHSSDEYNFTSDYIIDQIEKGFSDYYPFDPYFGICLNRTENESDCIEYYNMLKPINGIIEDKTYPYFFKYPASDWEVIIRYYPGLSSHSYLKIMGVVYNLYDGSDIEDFIDFTYEFFDNGVYTLVKSFDDEQINEISKLPDDLSQICHAITDMELVWVKDEHGLIEFEDFLNYKQISNFRQDTHNNTDDLLFMIRERCNQEAGWTNNLSDLAEIIDKFNLNTNSKELMSFIIDCVLVSNGDLDESNINKDTYYELLNGPEKDVLYRILAKEPELLTDDIIQILKSEER